MKALIFVGFFALGCGEIVKAEGDACDEGPQCTWPAVCCTAPRIPAIGDPLPICEKIDYCDAFLPFLVEGNPCQRAGAGPLDSCADPWICCPKTLTCLEQADCDAAPEPVPISPSGDPCRADGDCPAGEICEGISIRDREGTCTAIAIAPMMPGMP